MEERRKFTEKYAIDSETLRIMIERFHFVPAYTESGNKLFGGFFKSNTNATLDHVSRVERLAIAVFQENLKLEKRIGELEKMIEINNQNESIEIPKIENNKPVSKPIENNESIPESIVNNGPTSEPIIEKLEGKENFCPVCSKNLDVNSVTCSNCGFRWK